MTSKKLSRVSWKKIYEREYGVQYSEAAVSLFARARDHFPKISVAQVVAPGTGNNTAFYIDEQSWAALVEALDRKYASGTKNLKTYERKFLEAGRGYLGFAKKIAGLNLKALTNKALCSLFRAYQKQRDQYSVFVWSAFTLNDYVTDRAVRRLEPYIKKYGSENEKQEVVKALLRPAKRAAVFELQHEVQSRGGKLTPRQYEDLYERFKWLSCLDIHNKPWTKQAFRGHIRSFVKPQGENRLSFTKIIRKLKLPTRGRAYLQMARRLIYIKDARDDWRRQSVYHARNLYKELAGRMHIAPEDVSFVQEKEVVDFLDGKRAISKETIAQRKNGFIMYLDAEKRPVCLEGERMKRALALFQIPSDEEAPVRITGRVAVGGFAQGKVAVIRGVKDLPKVKKGDILIAVTTHPDYVPAMRKAAAIVTDEGGITSHAAIVSREFNIPCIVGTKIATKVLKDGDAVEVDASKGLVIILKKPTLRPKEGLSADDGAERRRTAA